MIHWILVILDLAGVSSSGRLHWQTPLGASCQEIRSCVPMFFSDRLVSGGSGAKHCYLLQSWETSFCFMVKSDAENGMDAESLGLVLVV